MPRVTQREGFYCHGFGAYVICEAPHQCNEECSRYGAIKLKGLTKRAMPVFSGVNPKTGEVFAVQIDSGQDLF